MGLLALDDKRSSRELLTSVFSLTELDRQPAYNIPAELSPIFQRLEPAATTA
jgi:hypothetical protein